MTQLERGNVLKDNNTNNQLKLSDGRTYDVDDIGNPLKRQGKGRPATKRLKACNEQKIRRVRHKNHKKRMYYMKKILKIQMGVNVVCVIKWVIMLPSVPIRKTYNILTIK
ncbi:unnamed protein product [Rhizophagus irregularis]|nr:unnamed protein product [Rhizophagus irregularis]